MTDKKPKTFPDESRKGLGSEETAKQREAIELIGKGKLDDAEYIYREMIKWKPQNYVLYENVGYLLRIKGETERADKYIQKAIELKSNEAYLHYNRGNALKGVNKLDEAIEEYKAAIQLKSEFPSAYNNLCITYLEQGELAAAIESCQKAIQLKPDYPNAYNSQGNALKEKGDLRKAISSYKKAIQLKPEYADAYYNLGVALMEQGDRKEAMASYKYAIKKDPGHLSAIINLGISYMEEGDLRSAIRTHKKAIEKNKEAPDTHWNLSLAMLLNGDYENGWEEYEWRTKKENYQCMTHALPLCEKWNGEKLQKGSNLLLVSEQGLGDTLQFMRYAIPLRNQGISVRICAQTKLHGLIRSSGIDQTPLSPQEANTIKEGLWLPLMSTPRQLRVNPNQPIINEPYINVSEELKSKWRNKLNSDERPIIGINWQGNPRVEAAGLKGRSIKLELFKEIIERNSVRLLSLQKGYGSDQLSECSFKNWFVHCQEEISNTWDFEETAAIIENCDLIITSDTSVAHLAGGMGKETWLLLSRVPEWRWGIEGKYTFWYPSMKLFRQKKSGDWREVLERVGDELRNRMGG